MRGPSRRSARPRPIMTHSTPSCPRRIASSIASASARACAARSSKLCHRHVKLLPEPGKPGRPSAASKRSRGADSPATVTDGPVRLQSASLRSKPFPDTYYLTIHDAVGGWPVKGFVTKAKIQQNMAGFGDLRLRSVMNWMGLKRKGRRDKGERRGRGRSAEPVRERTPGYPWIPRVFIVWLSMVCWHVYIY